MDFISFKRMVRKLLKNEKSVVYKVLLALNWMYNKKFYSEQKKHLGTRNSDKKIYIIRRRDGQTGLFSNVIVFLAHIKIAEQLQSIPVIDMMNYKNLYLDDEYLGKVNSWEFFFDQPTSVTLEEAYHSKNVILSDAGVPADRPNDSYDFLSNINGVADQWIGLYEKYIHVKPEILKRAEEEFKSNVRNDEKVVGVCCRGAAYSSLRAPGHPIQPSVEDLINKTIEFIRLYGCNKIYVSTEDGHIIDKFIEYFGDKVFCKKREYWYEGNIVKISRGQDYLAQLIMLSKCNYLISSRCSGAVGVSLMPNSFERVYYFDKGEF